MFHKEIFSDLCFVVAVFVAAFVVVVVVLFCFFFCFFVVFYIFVSDLPVRIQDKKSKTLFANDSSLGTSGKTVKKIEVMLQKSINKVPDWCEKNVCVFILKKSAWS